MPRKRKKRFIDGIYNYCDRWCERCAFTARCRTFAMCEADAPSAEARDPAKALFWQSLEQVLNETEQMVREMAAERGVDLDHCDDAHRVELDARERRRQEAFDGPLSAAAQAYAGEVKDWFDARPDLFDRCAEDLFARLRMGIEGDDPKADAVAFYDAVEVIRWYHLQIAVKLIRASTQSSAADEDMVRGDKLMEGIHARDRDGSAKVALIGIDRSLAAWSVLWRLLPDEADRVLDLLARLSRLRSTVEAAFPKARAFVRPGFDTAPN